MTRELLLAVMPDIEKHDKVEIKIIEDELWFHYVRQKYKHKPNIYELAHKCKEWAKRNGYYINSWVTSNNDGFAESNEYGYTAKEMFNSDTEPEAIFLATQWILEQKEIEL